MLSQRLMMAAAAGAANRKATPPPYIEDMFSAYTYTGTGATQSIVNGIDLAGKGGMVWIKSRTYGQSNTLMDTIRGVGKFLITDTTGGGATVPATYDLTAFNSNGFSLGPDYYGQVNSNGSNQVSWSFAKAAKFFDVVGFTTDGNGAATFSHALGITPGMIVVKNTATTERWHVYHQSLGMTKTLYLEGTDAAATVTLVNSVSVSSVTVGGLNANQAHVAYLFAHDTSANGLIQCGSFTTDASGQATVSLGWEPQYINVKQISGTGGAWYITDTAREMQAYPTAASYLRSNSSGAEYVASQGVYISATGFTVSLNAAQSYSYLAIRRGPMKLPTSGTQVYNAIARTGTGVAATVTGVGFPPDLVFSGARSAYNGLLSVDRLRGHDQQLKFSQTAAEATLTGSITSFAMDEVNVGADGWGVINDNSFNFISWFFRRYPGVFDEVCSSTLNRAESHNLGVRSELTIVKDRDSIVNWEVMWCSSSGTSSFRLKLNTTDAGTSYGDISASTTASIFYSPIWGATNTVTYLFATLAGISKVGSYTGDGTSGQTINCGFSTGARFVMIKRTDSTGDWFVWDSVRGIIAANDPHLAFNTTSAEVTTDDSIDPDNSGFVVNQNVTTNINVTSATYIFLAFA